MKLIKEHSINFTSKVKFDTKTLEKGHHKITYKGVRTIKCPFDYVIYQMLILDLKPDLIVEIGAGIGGASLYMADLLEINSKGIIHSIDIVDSRDEIVKKNKRIKFFLGGYQNYDLKNLEGFNNILIIEDGSHTYEDVKAALDKFHKYVSKDSYFIVEDGILDKLGWKKKFNGGPNKAIKEFLIKNDAYIIDRKFCDFFGINATFNTNGYLKKIK